MTIEDHRVDTVTLQSLIERIERCAPPERLGYREQVLAHGVACIRPLVDLVTRSPGLAASVASWLELLAKRDPEVRPDAVDALARLARGRDGHYAHEALARLGVAAPAERKTKEKGERLPTVAQGEVHARIIAAARARKLITYSELGTNRAHIGKYLYNIGLDEASQGHPPLAAIVVSKTTGRPGDGFMQAMRDVGFARPGETMEMVWERAIRDVHDHWAGDKVGAHGAE